jgi:para-aminobenzoate synthetase component 1
LPVITADESPLPRICLAAFRAVYRFDPATRRAEVAGSDAQAMRRLADRLHEAAARNRREPHLPGQGTRLPSPRPRTTDARFREAVQQIRDWIRAGDVYQVNLSRRLDAEPVCRTQLPSLYARLSAESPAPFAAYLDTGDAVVLCNSPERFLRVAGHRIETCPIKGTRPRGRTPEEDRLLAKELLTAAKDRAEHVMIVDVERNDLGRICGLGSVRVPRLASLRSYATVHHLVSSVEGTLRDPCDWRTLLAATFPGGSITGAPKVRAMELIEALEPVRRGVYTGALGYFDSAGGIDLAIAIRTAVAREGRLELHLGGGIVADSDPEAELRETHDKGQAFARLWGAPDRPA